RPPAPHHTSSLPLPDALPISSDPPRHLPVLSQIDHRTQQRRQRHNLARPARPEDVANGLEVRPAEPLVRLEMRALGPLVPRVDEDRKSTRLNSSHVKISYAVF